MKDFKIVITLVIATTFFSCENDKHDRIDFRADKDLCQIFNADEIESMASIINFVDSAVVSITKNNSKAEAYHDFFKIYGESLQKGKRIVPFIEIEKYNFLESLDEGTFNAIWRFDTQIDRVKYKDTILTNVDYITCLTMNPQGRYMEYIKQIGKRDKRYKDLHDIIYAMGDISTSTGLWTIHDEFDFGKVENRIFAAIYILKIEDTYETKLDRFFSGKNSMHNN